MSFDTQSFPWSLIGKRTNRPQPNGIQEGYTYFADDTDQGFILVIDPYTKVHSWHQFAGLGSVPLNMKFAGGIAPSGQQVNGFIADTVGVSSSLSSLGYVFHSSRVVRKLVVHVVADTSGNPTTVFVLRNGSVTPISLVVPAGSPVGTIIQASGAVAFAGDTDRLDVFMTNDGTGDDGAIVEITATIEYT